MPKEKSVNPAQAERKKEKAKQIKKGKAEQLERRNEKLAKRNPVQVQKQLNELRALESSGGKLTSHEKSLIEGLERDLKAITKARQTLGDKAPTFARDRDAAEGERGRDHRSRGPRAAGNSVLGKRPRYDDARSSDEDVPDDVKSIPMPRDTPPPIPKEILDAWYQKRRDERMQQQSAFGKSSQGTDANSTSLGANPRNVGNPSGGSAEGREKRETGPAQTVYEAKPQIRDLRKEAVAFVPAAVRAKIDKVKGVGGLVEPEEADALERAGYLGSNHQQGDGHTEQLESKAVRMEEVDDEDG